MLQSLTNLPEHRPVSVADAREPRRLVSPAADRMLPAAQVRWLWGTALVLAAVYATVSVRRHQRLMSTGYDLGIFEQAVRCYAHLHLPVSELKGPGFQLLGDHFSPILATLAPFYWLWPSPLTLLMGQAVLLAIAVVPLTRWAWRMVGRQAAGVVGIGFGTSWGIAQAVGFDFHEVCFAVPLLAFSLTALGEGRLRAAVAWALPLLLVKEDLGFTVGVIGGLVAWRGARRLGLVTAAAGFLGSLVEVTLIIPAFNPTGTFPYWGNLVGSDSSPRANSGPVLHLLYQATIGLITPGIKVSTLLVLLAPTAFLALRSPLMWVAVPTLAWRFASNDPLYWGTKYHYSAVLMPIVFAAFIEALTRWRAAGARYALAASSAVTAALLPFYPLHQLMQPSTWRTNPRLAAAHRILDRIPDGATVAASNHLVPQLTNRTTVTDFGFTGSRPSPQWIVVDTKVEDWPLAMAQKLQELAAARSHGYRTVAAADGLVLLHRA